jgi:DNA-binding transcriptional LysR family regulator
MRKTTNLNDIRVFVAAEVGTFSAASANVELPVSTITRSLTQLENISICCSFVQVSEPALPHAGRNISYTARRALRLLRAGASFSINIVPAHPAFRVPDAAASSL